MSGMDMNYEIDGELFIWDEIKAKKNWRKHGVHFEEAATLFPLFHESYLLGKA